MSEQRPLERKSGIIAGVCGEVGGRFLVRSGTTGNGPGMQLTPE
jgi:hypothetical protein